MKHFDIASLETDEQCEGDIVNTLPFSWVYNNSAIPRSMRITFYYFTIVNK